VIRERERESERQVKRERERKREPIMHAQLMRERGERAVCPR